MDNYFYRDINMQIKNGIQLLAAILLVGCASYTSDPILASKLRSFDDEKILDEGEIYRIGMIGRYMLEPEARQKVLHIISGNQEYFSKQKSGSFQPTLATSTQALTDLSVGQLDSSLGNTLGTAVAIGEMAYYLFSGDGSFDEVSGFYLPEIYEGEVIDNPEEAQQAIIDIYTNYLKKGLSKYGYKVTCIHNCGKNYAIYDAHRYAPIALESLIYAPRRVGIIVGVDEAIEISADDKVSSIAAGFEVNWLSKHVHASRIVMLADPVLNEDGSIKLTPLPEQPQEMSFRGNPRVQYTDFHHKIFKEIYSNPYLFYGTLDDHPKRLYFNNSVYRITFNSSANGFNRKLIDVAPERTAADFVQYEKQ